MRPIEFERWKPSADDPNKREYDGQRTAQEIFEELKHCLESTGYLPDEYFLMDREWENGRKIPKVGSALEKIVSCVCVICISGRLINLAEKCLGHIKAGLLPGLLMGAGTPLFLLKQCLSVFC